MVKKAASRREKNDSLSVAVAIGYVCGGGAGEERRYILKDSGSYNFFFNQTRLLMTRQNPTLVDLVKIEFC